MDIKEADIMLCNTLEKIKNDFHDLYDTCIDRMTENELRYLILWALESGVQQINEEIKVNKQSAEIK